MPWQFNSREPVFIQISDKLRSEIVTGKYAQGSQFPSIRQLAAIASVNPNTMQKALQTLEDEEILVSRGTIGRYVTSDTAILEASREKIQKQALLRFISEAEELGLTKEDLIKMIQKEGESS